MATSPRFELPEEHAMNDAVEMRIRSAAAAGWWTLLIGVAFLVVQWILYLAFMSSRPAWLLFLWGPNTSWETINQVWFWALVLFKVCLGLLALVSLWLTLWARQLRKR
jgi:hypothetical protein